MLKICEGINAEFVQTISGTLVDSLLCIKGIELRKLNQTSKEIGIYGYIKEDSLL